MSKEIRTAVKGLLLLSIAIGVFLYSLVVYNELDEAHTLLGYAQAEARIQKSQNEQLQDKLTEYESSIDALQRTVAEQTVIIEQAASAESAEYITYTAAELEEVIGVVIAECGNQSIEGQMAVAQCIHDRYKAGYGGTTLHELLTAPNQFAAAYTGNRSLYPGAYEAVVRVFIYGERIFNKDVIYFYNPVVANPLSVDAFERNNEYLGTVGDHVFRSW